MRAYVQVTLEPLTPSFGGQGLDCRPALEEVSVPETGGACAARKVLLLEVRDNL